MAFEAWQLGLIDSAGYNGIREEHIEAVAKEIEKLPQTNIDNSAFRGACYRAGIDSDNFTLMDLDTLQDYLSR